MLIFTSKKNSTVDLWAGCWATVMQQKSVQSCLIKSKWSDESLCGRSFIGLQMLFCCSTEKKSKGSSNLFNLTDFVFSFPEAKCLKISRGYSVLQMLLTKLCLIWKLPGKGLINKESQLWLWKLVKTILKAHLTRLEGGRKSASSSLVFINILSTLNKWI